MITSSYSQTKEIIIDPRERFQQDNALIDVFRDVSIEIGNSKNKPYMRIMRWRGECQFALRLIQPVCKEATLIVDKGVVKWLTPQVEAQACHGQQGDQHFTEFGVLLRCRPKSNEIIYEMETDGLRFCYQHPLTAQEVAEGCLRDPKFDHSYAVFHADKNKCYSIKGVTDKDYRTGKAFHIGRPWAKDAAGRRVWAKLDIDTKAGLLKVIVPQFFLDAALYPVYVDPYTLGYDGAGASSLTFGDWFVGNNHTTAPGEAGDATAFVMYGAKTNTGGCYVQYGCYADSGGSPHNQPLLSVCALKEWDNLSLQWFSTPLTWPGIEASTQYWLFANGSYTTPPETIPAGRFDVDAGNVEYHYTSLAGPSDQTCDIPSSCPTTARHGTDRKVSMYVSYESAAAGAFPFISYYKKLLG